MLDLLHLCFITGILYICYKVIDYIIRIPRISNLTLRYILITGCDTGFGNAAAKRLDRMGCHVIAACLTEKGEVDLRKSCSQKLKTVHLDVTRQDSIKRAYDMVFDMLPHRTGLWGLVNNAGIAGKAGPDDWLTMDDYKQVISINLLGLINVSKTFLPLIKKEKGRLVNTASIEGRLAGVMAPYCVSKYGVEAYSDCLRRELKSFSLSVHLIEPGFFKTNLAALTERSTAEAWKVYHALPKSIKEQYGEQYLKDYLEIYDNFQNKYMSVDIDLVVDAYIHALTGMYPRARYTVGKDVKVWLTIQALPEWLGDWIMNKFRPVPAVNKT